MKKTILILAIFCIIPVNSLSQENDTEGNELFRIGPYLSLKGGLNSVNTPSGRRNGFLFNNIPDFGIAAYISLSTTSDLGLRMELGHSSYSYKIIRHADETAFDHRYSYLTFSPNLAFGVVNIGFDFGMPLSAENGEEIDTDDLNILAGFNLGAEVRVWGDETGGFDVFLKAGIMLTGIYNDYHLTDPLMEKIPAEPPQVITDQFNHRAVSISLGFRYMFSIY